MDVINKLKTLKLSHKESLEISREKLGLQGNTTNLQYYLVRKIASTRKANVEAFQKVMKKVWNFCQGITIDNINDNLFLINLQYVHGRDRILEKRPWCFDRYLILLDLLEKMVFDTTLFLVKFHNVPIGRRNKKCGQNSW